MTPSARMYLAAIAAYVGLIALTLAWEGWLAPAPNLPPGFWLTVKSVPLLLPLLGLLHGRVYTFKWASLLLMLYLTEGLVLSVSRRADPFSLHAVLPYALLETVLVTAFMVFAIRYVRAMRRETRQRPAETES